MRISFCTNSADAVFVICTIRQLEYDSIRNQLWLHDTLDGCYVLECDDAYAQMIFRELEREGFVMTQGKIWRVCD